MKVAVRYVSRSGNTKKVAEAIAKAIGTEAKDCSFNLEEEVDVLFLGGSVYWGGIDKKLKKFIQELDVSHIKYAVTFGTSSIKKEADKEAENLLRSRNITVADHIFHCFGSFSALHKDQPNEEDLKKASAFAIKVVEDLEKKRF